MENSKNKLEELKHIKNINSGSNESIMKKWKESGMLDALTTWNEEHNSMASLMECEASQLLKDEIMYNEVEGNLISLAKNGYFDVITHGCNCRSIMSAGIAVPMNLHFDCSQFPMELSGPSPMKLGNIDFELKEIYNDGKNIKTVYVVNSYTQNHPRVDLKPIDYEALTLCMRKINHRFKGMHIGLPKIGAGLAGGDWNRIKKIIQTELKNCKVTVVIYNK